MLLLHLKSRFAGIALLIILPVVLNAAVYPSKYNIVYHRISVTVDPGTSGNITNGSVTTYFRTTAAAISQIGFDFDSHMSVGSVSYHGSALPTYTFSSNVIVISFPANIPISGTLDSITINFSGTPVSPITSVPSGYNYSSSYRCIYTLGESFRGSTWWPCKDSLTDKIDSVDMIITTPSAYRAGSNGVVTESLAGPNRICVWKTRHPIATYMINFAAADYTNYSFNATSLTHTVPVSNYLYSGMDFNSTYKGYLNMLQNVMPSYATLLNTDYPFYDEKYGTAECGSGWGALEVQSMTFIDRSSYSGGSTLAHELAHQWFGDKLTTGDWHQIWLNEGFAQFFESIIYPENLLSAGTAASQRASLKNAVTSSSTTYVSNISDADNIFIGSGTQPYQKGAMTISMLRSWLGDANFFTALHNYLNAPGLAYNFTSVDSLQKYMQQQSPNDLTNFFNAWVNKPGRATYSVKYQYVSKGVYIQLTQSPTYSGAGYFDMPVPINITNGTDLDTTVVIIDRAGKLYNSATGYGYNSNTIYYPLSATPTNTPVFDPNNNVLATSSSISSSSSLSTLITLPVEQINFSITGDPLQAMLHWYIIADDSLESIQVQRSADGIDFSPVAMLLPEKVSFNGYNGRFKIPNTTGNQQFYRLKITKKDGNFIYSAIKILDLQSDQAIRIYPNPVHYSCTIQMPSGYSNQNGATSLLIYNSSGVLVHQEKIGGSNASPTIDCRSLVPGSYSAVMENTDRRSQKTFLKE